jgi:Bacterial Ig domain
MKLPLLFSIILVFPLIAVSPDSVQKSRRRANRPPSIESFTSSLTNLQICPFFPRAVVHDEPRVTLVVNATDPDGDSLNYEYSSKEGTISGKGQSVIWDLDRLPRGPHKVHVTVTDGRGGKANASLTVTTVDASGCDRPPPPCPSIKVSCSDEMDQSTLFIFSAVIKSNVQSTTPVSFDWKTNEGTIVKGQNSREIEVSAARVQGVENITATVSVGGFDPSCSGTVVTCTTKILR